MKSRSTRARSLRSKSVATVANGIAILASGYALVAGVKVLVRKALQVPARTGWMIVVALLIGCSNPLGPEQDSLSAARARWTSFSSVDGYTFQFRRACFCPPDTVRETRIEVLSGIVNSATYTDTGEPVTVPLDELPTIDDLFDEIQSAIDNEAFTLVATYDQDRGFPTSVSIDFIEFAIDDEMSFTVTAFQAFDTFNTNN